MRDTSDYELFNVTRYNDLIQFCIQRRLIDDFKRFEEERNELRERLNNGDFNNYDL